MTEPHINDSGAKKPSKFGDVTVPRSPALGGSGANHLLSDTAIEAQAAPGISTRYLLPSCALVALLIATFPPVLRAGTNEWLKPDSGYWEEPYWSANRPPAAQDLVLFDSPGFKALAIGYSTVTNFPQSLSMQSLTITAPSNSSNLLLLNWTGFTVPLSVSSNLVVGTNGSLVSHSSALVASNFYLGATAQFLDQSAASFTNVLVGDPAGAKLDLSNSAFATDVLQLGAWGNSLRGVVNQSGGTNHLGTLSVYPGGSYTLREAGILTGHALEMYSTTDFEDARFTLTGGYATFDSAGNVLGSYPGSFARLSLTGGSFEATNLRLNNGSFVQTGGTNVVSLLELSPNVFTSGSYTLSNGLLISTRLIAGMGAGNQPPSATFTQNGGAHTNAGLTLSGTVRSGFALALGKYLLEGGLLVSGAEAVNMGMMNQAGGTNLVDVLGVSGGGSYHLSAGQLLSSNLLLTTAQVETVFDQTGGDHRIRNLLSLDRLVTYSLGAGTLEVSSIEIHPGGQLLLSGGTVTHSGLCTIDGGLLKVGTPELQLGQLRVTGSNTLVTTRPTHSTISFLPGAVTIRFRDSHEIPWTSPGLFIENWNATDGPDHIYIGTNSAGLTPWQLSLVTFSNPGGLPPGNYPATLLTTGELVPSTAEPILVLTTQPARLVLSWSGPYQLYTSTNVTGPFTPLYGTTSPYTNTFLEPQRFFRLGAH